MHCTTWGQSSPGRCEGSPQALTGPYSPPSTKIQKIKNIFDDDDNTVIWSKKLLYRMIFIMWLYFIRVRINNKIIFEKYHYNVGVEIYRNIKISKM